MKTWNEKIVEAISALNRPVSRRELESLINNKDGLGPYIYNAKKAGVIKVIKIPPSRIGFYCNPDWLDENGQLKSEYSFDPFWDKLPNFLKQKLLNEPCKD